MTTATLKNLLTYRQILARQQTGALRTSEIPTEANVSLPMPTLRTGEPGFAFFANKTSNMFTSPVTQSPPDRWWIVNATNGSLALYALSRVLSFAPEISLDRVTLPPERRTVAQVIADTDAIEQQMNALAPLFFAGEPGEKEARETLLQKLKTHLEEPMMPTYRALAPDFFAWLST